MYCQVCDLTLNKKNYKSHLDSKRHVENEQSLNEAVFTQLQKPDNQCVPTLDSIASKLNQMEKILVIILEMLDSEEEEYDDEEDVKE